MSLPNMVSHCISIRRRLSGHMSTPVGGAQAAVHQLSTCLVHVEAWLKASRLRLYPAKTQVMWLGSVMI